MNDLLDPQSLQVLDDLKDGVYITDRNRQIIFWNRGAEAITGFSAEQVTGRRCSDGLLRHVDERGRCLCRSRCPLAATMEDARSREASVYLHHRDGRRVPVRARTLAIRDRGGRIVAGVETFSKGDECVVELTRLRELQQFAFLDELTGVANRRFILQSLADRQRALDESETPLAFAIADVDRFKRFNDEHGHDCGDAALTKVAGTLAGNCRAVDLIGRWGGEEFVVLVQGLDPGSVRAQCEKLRSLVAATWVAWRGAELAVTVSIGFAMAQRNEDGMALYRRADAALYRAKRSGRNRVIGEPRGVSAA